MGAVDAPKPLGHTVLVPVLHGERGIIKVFRELGLGGTGEESMMLSRGYRYAIGGCVLRGRECGFGR